jgi:hypothetical protein
VYEVCDSGRIDIFYHPFVGADLIVIIGAVPEDAECECVRR